MMRHRGLLALMALVVISGASAPVQAGIDSKGYIGGVFGLHIPDQEDTSSRPAFGVVGGAKLGTEFGLGGYYFSSTKEETIAGQQTDFNYSMYGIEGAYHFEGEAAGVYLGARVGLTNIDVGTADYSPYHWGLVVGYNHWLMSNFSLGGEASFTSVNSDTDRIGALTSTLESFNIIAFLGTAKFWF